MSTWRLVTGSHPKRRLAAAIGAVSLLLAGLAGLLAPQAPADPTQLTMGPQAMEGDLKVTPGDKLQVGYDFTMPGNHPAATVMFSDAKVTFEAACATGVVLPPIVVGIGDQSYDDPPSSSLWYPSGDQHSAAVYQGSIIVPDLCTGGQMTLKGGGIFTTGVSSTDTTDKVNVRWHYSAHGTSGSWSATKSVVPGTPPPSTTTTTGIM
jgi:hypothetical protein